MAEISKLPPETSQRYAKGSEAYDKTFGLEGPQVSKHSTSSSLAPLQSHLETLVPQGKTVQPRAYFVPPDSFTEGRSSAFGSQLTKAIGPTSSWEDRSEKARALASTLPPDSPIRKGIENFIKLATELNASIVAIKSESMRFLSSGSG